MSTSIGVAVIGTGRIGTVHIKDILHNLRLKLLWLVEADVTRANNLHKQLQLSSDVSVCDIQNINDVYNDERVSCVLVCTPVQTHENLVKEALHAGKAVFCEKPLATCPSGVKECYQLAEQKDLPLFCAFNRRYDPQLRAIHDRIRAGDLGQIRLIKSTSRDPPEMLDPNCPKGQAHIFSESAVHDIDVICWLVGEYPYKVYATGYGTNPEFHEANDIDICFVTLNFPSGAIGNFEVSWASSTGYDQRVEVLGTKGMLQSTNQGPQLPVFTTPGGTTLPPIYHEFVSRYSEAYNLELDHFADLVEGKVEAEVTSQSTLAVHSIIAACKKSYKSGTVISMKEFYQ